MHFHDNSSIGSAVVTADSTSPIVFDNVSSAANALINLNGGELNLGQSSNGDFSGRVSGPGTINKTGSASINFTGDSSDFNASGLKAINYDATLGAAITRSGYAFGLTGTYMVCLWI